MNTWNNFSNPLFCVQTVKYVIQHNTERNHLKHNDSCMCIMCIFTSLHLLLVCTGVQMHVEATGQHKVSSSFTLPFIFLRGFGVANSVVMTSQRALRSFCTCYLSGEVADVCHCVLSARDPNSNPHGCMISTLADMPSFQPNCKHSQRI